MTDTVNADAAPPARGPNDSRLRRMRDGVARWFERVMAFFWRRGTSRIGGVFGALDRWDGRINVARLMKWTAIAVLTLVAIGFTVVLLLVYYPNTQIPPPEPIDTVRYLEQG